MEKQKILAVDDSRVMRRIISQAIEALGFVPLTARHGQEALETLEQEVSDTAMVLLDWNMPVLDGLGTLEALKADERFCDLPVMMVTTETEGARVIQAIQAGAKHYVTKPFTQEDLVTKIMECLGRGA